MLKPIPERITYAQKKLIALIEERKLRNFCIENNILHSAAYRLAFGEQILTYKLMLEFCNVIPPIEWLYFTDEKLPFEPVLLPKTEFKASKYVIEHKKDYRELASKYNLDINNAKNIFLNHRVKPTPLFIRKVCDSDGVNPIEFFTPSEDALKSVIDFIPERGDITSVQEKMIFVISKHELNTTTGKFTGCIIQSDNQNGIELSGTNTKGSVCPYNLASFSLEETRSLIEKAPAELIQKVLEEVRKSFE